MRKQYFSIIFILIILFPVSFNVLSQVQKSFSLQEAIHYAMVNNYNLKNAKLDYMIQQKKVKEYISTGLPQVSSDVKYSYFFNIPTTLMPDFLTQAVVGINEHWFSLQPSQPVQYSEFLPIQFGTTNNATFDFSVNQLVFNGAYFIGLEASKKLKQLSDQEIKKTEMDTKEAVAKAYYLVLVSEENKLIVDSTLLSIQKILNDTREYYKNGFVENTDVDQFELLASNLEMTKKTVDIKTTLSYKFLKIQMGYPLDEEIILTDKLETLFPDALNIQTGNYDYSNSIDYQIMETQKKLALINMKYEKSKYYPSVNAFYSYSNNAMRSQFDIFDFSQKWYPTTIAGLTINIPLFNSGMKMYRVQQAKFSYDKSIVTQTQVKESLQLQEESVRTDYQIAILTYQNKKKSLNIAKEIYYKTSVKYKEGISSSLDLSQSYNQYLSNQSDYINSLLQLLNAKQELEKIYSKAYK